MLPSSGCSAPHRHTTHRVYKKMLKSRQMMTSLCSRTCNASFMVNELDNFLSQILHYSNTWEIKRCYSHHIFISQTNNVGEHLISFPDSLIGLKEWRNYQNEEVVFLPFHRKSSHDSYLRRQKVLRSQNGAKSLSLQTTWFGVTLRNDTERWKIGLVCSLPMAPSQYMVVFVAQSLGLEDSREHADPGFCVGESCKEQGVGLNPCGFLPTWDLWFWSMALQLW